MLSVCNHQRKRSPSTENNNYFSSCKDYGTITPTGQSLSFPTLDTRLFRWKLRWEKEAMFKAADIVFYGFQGTMPRKYTHISTLPSSFCSRSQVMSNQTAMTDSCHVIPATCAQLTSCFFINPTLNIFKVLVRPWVRPFELKCLFLAPVLLM